MYGVHMSSDRKTPRQTLTRERVLDEAWELIRAEGTDGLSMRALSQRLGVVPMALYRHVQDKDDLLAIGAITGVLVGVAQALLMPAPLRVAWAVAVAVLWPLAWQVTAAVGVDLTQGWAVFGASGAVFFSASLAGLLALVGRRLHAEVTA